MLALFVIAALFATQCYSQSYDPVACGASRPNHLYANETSPGKLTSPNYNQSYPSDSRCEWVLHAQDVGQVVELKFFEFDVEYCTDCKCDGVEVYDGNAPDSAKLIGTYCGVSGKDPIPDKVTSTGQDMYVRFRSDSSAQFTGFVARFGYPTTSTACTAQSPQVDNRAEGAFYSTNWPLNYPANEVCSWRLEAPAGQRIRISVNDFASEVCCSCDYLEIYDGSDDKAPRFGHWYGVNVLPPVIVTTGNVAFIKWETDVSVTATGFMLSFEHVV